MVKNLPAVQETWVQSLGWEDPLEAGMATHSVILAWRFPMDRGAWWATVHGVTKNQTDWPTQHSTDTEITNHCKAPLSSGLLLLSSHFNHVWLFVTLWTIACQVPLSMGFPRQEYCSRLLFSSPGDLPSPGIKPTSPALAGRFYTTEPLRNCEFMDIKSQIHRC